MVSRVSRVLLAVLLVPFHSFFLSSFFFLLSFFPFELPEVIEGSHSDWVSYVPNWHKYPLPLEHTTRRLHRPKGTPREDL